jgi:hypothetical protein
MRAMLGRKPYTEGSVWPQYLDLTNLTTTYVDLDAVLAKSIAFIYIHNTTSAALILATGAAGSEQPFFMLGAGSSHLVPTEDILKVGVRLSVKTVTGTAGAGYLLLNGYNG